VVKNNPAGGAGVARPGKISAREDRDSRETAIEHLRQSLAPDSYGLAIA